MVQVAREGLHQPVDVVGRGAETKTSAQGAAAVVDPGQQGMFRVKMTTSSRRAPTNRCSVAPADSYSEVLTRER